MEAVLQVQTILKPHSKTMKPYSQSWNQSLPENTYMQKLVYNLSKIVKNTCLTIISQDWNFVPHLHRTATHYNGMSTKGREIVLLSHRQSAVDEF